LHSRAERGAGVFVVFGKVAENREKVDYHATALRGMLKMPKKFGTGIEYTGYTTPAAESPPPLPLIAVCFPPHKRHAPDAACTAMRPECSLWEADHGREKIAK